jgi:hypothetical protein
MSTLNLFYLVLASFAVGVFLGGTFSRIVDRKSGLISIASGKVLLCVGKPEDTT